MRKFSKITKDSQGSLGLLQLRFHIVHSDHQNVSMDANFPSSFFKCKKWLFLTQGKMVQRFTCCSTFWEAQKLGLNMMLHLIQHIPKSQGKYRYVVSYWKPTSAAEDFHFQINIINPTVHLITIVLFSISTKLQKTIKRTIDTKEYQRQNKAAWTNSHFQVTWSTFTGSNF